MNKIEVRHSLLSCLIIWLMSFCAQASMWSDPGWEQMLKESELIALVEVIEGGRFVAKVRVLTTFKGGAAPEFYVTEFNNHNWPADAIKTETFKEKDRYYLFLTRREESVHYLQFMAAGDWCFVRALAGFVVPGFGRRSSSVEFKAGLEAAKSGLLWGVWTPTAGDLPVEDEKARYSLLSTGYSRYAPARNRDEFERFLRAALAYQDGAQIDPELLNRTLQSVREEVSKPAPRDPHSSPEEEQPSELSHQLATYFLSGGRAYDAAFEKIAASDDVNARFVLARLLGSIHDEPAGQLLLVMLKDASSIVQGEVVRQLAKGDPAQVGSVLFDALAKSGEGGIYPQGLMDPVRNQLDGGKIEIIRALGELKYEPAAPALITLLEGVEGAYDLQVVAGALEKMGNRDYARALEKLLWTGKIRVYEIANWARDHRLTDLKAAFERLLNDPPDDTFTMHLSSVVGALGVIGDDATAVQLTAYLEKLSAKKVAEFDDHRLSQELIGALGALRYKPARSAVEQSFFYWFGIDSAFAANPELLRTKRRIERKIERRAVWHLGVLTIGGPQALVFLENRGELTGGSGTEPKYRFVLHADLFSWSPSNAKADAVRSKLTKRFPKSEEAIGVTLYNFSNYIFRSGKTDMRINRGDDSGFLWRYGQYVQATRDPQDLRFAKFLMESGLAERWGAKDSLAEGLGSAPKP